MKKTLRIVAVALMAGTLSFAAGCASIATGYYHTQADLETRESAQRAGFTFRAFDPEIGGPSVSADVGEVLANLYGNHTVSMAVAGGIDAFAAWYVGRELGWWGGDGGGDDPQSFNSEIPTSNGRDVIFVQGDGNTIDTSTGHNTTDDHSNPEPVAP